MNQILQMPNNPINNIENNEDNEKNERNEKRKKNKHALFFRIYFSLSIFIMLFSFIYYFNKMSNIDKNEQLSKLLVDNYSIARLYADSGNAALINLSNGNNFSVIGILQIDKINLKYPILSNISDYLLQVAPCKFYGPGFKEPRKYLHCFS